MLNQDFFTQIWMEEKPIAPVLQILNFEALQNKPNNYIVRLSDSLAYLNCVLILKQKSNKQDGVINIGQFEFRRWSIVILEEYEVKRKEQTISKISLIIHKMSLKQKYHKKLGRPEELIQYLENQGNFKQPEPVANGKMTKQMIKQEVREENQVVNKPLTTEQIYQTSLCINDIEQKKEGKLLARVLRTKVKKIIKADDTQYTIFCFKLIDKNNEMIRGELIGSPALKVIREKRIEAGKIYVFENIQMNFNEYNHSKVLRFNKYEGMEIDSDFIDQKLLKQKFVFCNDNRSETCVTDIIGTIYEVEDEKLITTSHNISKKRSLLKLLEDGKLITISFWGENSIILSNNVWTKRQPIILLDIVKRGRFYQYNTESDLIRINQNPQILQRNPNLKQLLCFELKSKCSLRTINQCKGIQYRVQEPQNVEIYVYIQAINETSIYYSNCKQCNCRIKNQHLYCADCNSNHFNHKYSAYLTLADHTGTIKCTAFDESAPKIFQKTASELHQLKQEKKLSNYIRNIILCKEYLARIQFRKQTKTGNNKILVKNIVPVENKEINSKLTRNLARIKEFMEMA